MHDSDLLPGSLDVKRHRLSNHGLSNPRAIEKRANSLLQDKLTEFYGNDGTKIASFPVAEAVDKMAEVASADTLITGGVISQRLVDVAFTKGIKNIYGVKMGHVTKKPSEIRVVSWERHS